MGRFEFASRKTSHGWDYDCRNSEELFYEALAEIFAEGPEEKWAAILRDKNQDLNIKIYDSFEVLMDRVDMFIPSRHIYRLYPDKFSPFIKAPIFIEYNEDVIKALYDNDAKVFY